MGHSYTDMLRVETIDYQCMGHSYTDMLRVETINAWDIPIQTC